MWFPSQVRIRRQLYTQRSFYTLNGAAVCPYIPNTSVATVEHRGKKVAYCFTGAQGLALISQLAALCDTALANKDNLLGLRDRAAELTVSLADCGKKVEGLINE